ncbi:hypothetical protein HCEG_02897 [Histoplasma capsulatum var. duboisii H88]|uniref:EKC/KEOPS complex subunit BUD32 n=1 Tax=Ajellomyces capsulatus (strain H88) TaxID=544711 RepID=F0UAC0_AJEC8|nr:hypothetical protein HCEG_02897 [Histoplasma capsulatum var. duboisii H88]QSS49838.1 hypothetical protein I7I53_10314 [Histoplasma capsulatum var. duboisii H88]
MTLSPDGFLTVSECGNNRYLFKNGKQIIVTGPLSIDLSSLPLLGDITRVEGKVVTYEKRYTGKNTIPIADSDFPGIPRIDYYSLNHGTWSDCLPIEFGRGTDQDIAFKLAAWKTKSVHHDATFLSQLINNDNIVRLMCIVTTEDRFAGYGMERLYEYHSLASPVEAQVKKVLPAFIQETVEYLHQTAGIYHCDIRLGNIMVNGQGRLKLIDFDIAQADVQATPHTALPESQFFLGVSPRLDHLDISMSVLLMFTAFSDMPEEHKSQIIENPLEPFTFYLDNNLKRSDYFDNVQNRVQRKLRTHMECPDG